MEHIKYEVVKFSWTEMVDNDLDGNDNSNEML